MFKNLWNRSSSSKLTNEQAQTATLIVPEHTGNTIVFLYDEVDRDLWYDLSPHINTLILRLPDVFAWKYYHYPIIPNRNKSEHEAFVSDVQKAFLFIPCTSATFLTRFWRAWKIDDRLKPLLAQTYVQPIPLRAAHGVAQSMLAKPLAAYPSGHARDEACVQVIATLEQKLRTYQGMRGNTDGQATVALLEETKSPLFIAFPAYRK
jgi:hypothetical protein